MKKDWQIKKLKDICDKGSSNVNIKDLDKLDGKFPIYGASGFIKNVNFYHQEKEYIGIIKDGSGIGRTMLLPPKSSVIGTIQYILPKENNSIHFINYALQSLDLAKYKQGAAIPHIYFRDYGETELVVPPLAEQERIVKILDQKFAQIDALKQNAETNLNNAKALFQSELEKAFSNTEWENMRLGDLCEIITGPFGSSIHKSDYVENGIPMINPQNIINNRMIPLAKCLVSNEAAMRLTKYKLKNQDIVIARRGEMGRCAVVTEAEIDWLCGTGSFIIRPNSKKTVSVYLQRYLSSAKTKKELEKQSIGATMSNLNQGILSAIEIPLPPLEEQKRIVAHLDSLSEKVHQLEEIYTKQLVACDELKQSFLQKAFAGEL